MEKNQIIYLTKSQSALMQYFIFISVGILLLSHLRVRRLYSKYSGEPTRCISIWPGVVWLEAETTQRASQIRPSEVMAIGVSLWLTRFAALRLTLQNGSRHRCRELSFMNIFLEAGFFGVAGTGASKSVTLGCLVD